MAMAGLQDVDLRHLAALRAVAEEGSFGRAAQRLGFSQAAISQQVAALEKAAGAPVFDRPGGPRAVRLTPQGRLLLRHAHAVLDRMAQAADELAQLAAGTSGRLSVGTFQSVSVQLLPGIVSRLKAEAPDLDIRVTQLDTTGALLAALAEGAVDVAFFDAYAGQGAAPDGFAVDLVLSDPYVVLVALDDPTLATLPEGAPYPVAALAERPMVGHTECDALKQVETALEVQGVVPQYAFRTNDNGALQAMVRAGMGPALMPLLAVDESDPAVAVRLLDPPVPLRDVLVARHRGVHAVPAAERFASLAVELGGRAVLRPGWARDVVQGTSRYSTSSAQRRSPRAS